MVGSGLISSLKRLVIPDGSMRRLEEVRQTLDELCNTFVELKKEDDAASCQQSSGDHAGPETSSYLPPDAKVFGRDDVRELILTMILDSFVNDGEASAESSSTGAKRGAGMRQDDHGTGVLPIAGMSGVGKTTLAQVIYNHPNIEKHFPQRAWVYVSEHFSFKRTLQEILRSLQGNDSSSFSFNSEDRLETVVTKLREAIHQDERLFLVLDNVWDNMCKYRQDLLDAIYVQQKRGSVVLITTQSQNVAQNLGTMRTILLRTLPWDSFWPLFQYHAFGTVQDDQDSNQRLLDFAQEIAKKLDGSPLAAKVIGYLLRSRVDEDKWRRIAESEWWRVDEVVKNILPYLRVSYQQLSPRQRQCFAYCSIFPTNYLFDRDRLVQMWMAHDFIEDINGDGRRLEDVGRDWFDKLVAMSLFQPTLDKNKYVMHDLVRALAIAVSTNQCFVHRSESSVATPNIRHLALQADTVGENFADLHKYKNLRTLLIFANIESDAFFTCLDKMLENSRCLRVLDLSYLEAQGKEWPKAGSIKKLQFLDLSYTRIQRLRDFPRRLQVLQLRGYGSGSLPQSIVKLSELRHLYVDDSALLFISSIGQLTKMEELEMFSVRKGKGFMINELRNLQELRGQICIRGIHNVRSKDEAMEARLMEKKHLKGLALEGTRVPKVVLEGLQPHPGTQELKIRGYGGAEFPSWMMQPIPIAGLANLLCVQLSKCLSLVDLPPFGSLPCLKFLSLEILPSLKSVDGSSFGEFPSLEELKVSYLEAWEEWSVGVAGAEDGQHRQQFLPRIKVLHLTDCSSLKEVPRLSSMSTLSELEISRCGEYVKRLPSCTRVLASLRSLKISQCDHRVSISAHQLKSLENLELMCCKGLRLTDRFRCFTNLRTAKVLSCPELLSEICGDQEEEHLHEEEHCAHLLARLSTDKSLITGNYIQTLGRLPSLRDLFIYDLDNRQAFSEGQMDTWFQHLTSLESLYFAHCRALEQIPATLAGLSSMSRLIVHACHNIQSVPAGVLPRGLDSFMFVDIGHLASRINSHQAVDWPNIAHVPYIDVDSEVIQNLGNK
ncbi:putative disease resistance protein RGA3 [Oryza brachyantha]|uniref:putative disease resistance protein RGA3 n=1 Tax=Oryza brachyantha TaxID=4533 RepID=UPI0003EACDA1|nr:putative disease resistance protein RGA3 [Oryza brachyantha]